MPDDMFRPTVQTQVASTVAAPLQPQRILLPAIIGGPLIAMFLGLLNGRRLGLRPRAMAAIAVVGVLALAGRVTGALMLHGEPIIRYLGTVTGVLVGSVVVAVQKVPFRLFELRGSTASRLTGRALAATFGCALVEGAFYLYAVSTSR